MRKNNEEANNIQFRAPRGGCAQRERVSERGGGRNTVGVAGASRQNLGARGAAARGTGWTASLPSTQAPGFTVRTVGFIVIYRLTATGKLADGVALHRVRDTHSAKCGNIKLRPAAGSGATVLGSSRALRVGVLVLKIARRHKENTPALGNTPTPATAHTRAERNGALSGHGHYVQQGTLDY